VRKKILIMSVYNLVDNTGSSMKWIITLLSLLFLNSTAQDSLEIYYSIVQMESHTDHDVIKIKVPCWLKTSELIPQLKRVVLWPGDPPPQKTIYVYVFKETDPIGSSSKTGCIYIPGKGFLWDLREWKPDLQPITIPTDSEIAIYTALVESIIKKGATIDNRAIREEIAGRYHLSLGQLDSIYSRVKRWWWLEKKNREQSSRELNK